MKIILIIILMSYVSVLSASSLNDLLMTKSDRLTLDNMRKQGLFKNTKSEAKTNGLRLSGIVFRKGHAPVVFVGDKNTMKSRFINESVHVHTKKLSPNKPKVKVTKNKSTRYMKPGQIWSASNSKVVEAYKLKQAE